MTLPRTETFELDGKTYTLRIPPLKETRKVMDLVHRIAPVVTSLEKHEMADFFSLAASGHISADEIEKLILLFAPHADVDVGGDRVLYLKDERSREELWAEAPELQYDFVTKCFSTVFEGILGKSRAVVAKLEAAKAAQAAAAKAESQSQSPSE